MKLDVDFTCRKDEFEARMNFCLFESCVGIFGPSGSGKSTLFRVLAGLIRPQFGRIALDDEILFQSDSRIFVPPHRRRIGLVFQDARLFPHWNVAQNLRAGSRLDEAPYSFDDVVSLLAVDKLLDRNVTTLSGGEQQRVALGRALLSSPRLLLMDEPVTGLDTRLKSQVLPFLSRVYDAFGIPCMYISHDLSEIQQMTDYLVLVQGGRCVNQGHLKHLIKEPGVLRHFSGARLLNILKLNVQSHDARDGVTLLGAPQAHEADAVCAELWEDLPLRSEVTVGIAPTEIALALHRVEGASIQNQWAGSVEQVIHAPDRSLCIVDTAVGSLMVDIAPRSERQLGLEPGKPVYCLFKAKALQPIGKADYRAINK